MMLVSIPSAFFGSWLLTSVSNDFMKPLLLVILTVLLVYTFFKKDLGYLRRQEHTEMRILIYGILISIPVGFYDGFIGPGTGSLLVLAFVSVLGFDFLHASANAKFVNLATNAGSLALFIAKGKIIWAIALPMAVCNALGGYLGAKVAISRGNSFIRLFFLIVVSATLVRFAWDVWRG